MVHSDYFRDEIRVIKGTIYLKRKVLEGKTATSWRYSK